MVEKQTAVKFNFLLFVRSRPINPVFQCLVFFPGIEKKNPFCKCEIGNNARCKIVVNDKAWLAGMGHTLFLITW